MTVIFLVRHASYSCVDDILVGRMPNVRLSERGHEEANSLAERLKSERITAIHSSPQERAYETAVRIGKDVGLPVEITSALDEIDVGEWTGRDFATLECEPGWQLWNIARASARPPCGESMNELRHRVMRHLGEVRGAHPQGRIVMVSHAEVIRAVILDALGLSLDEFARITLAPASISTVGLDRHRATVISINEVGVS